MENNIEKLRSFIDELISKNGRGKLWFVERHMFSVSNFAAMIAMKRNLDSQIATIIGLMHDIHTILTDNPVNHAEFSSLKSREILSELKIVSDAELQIICNAIKNHSLKNLVHDEYSEIIKDADVLSHYFYNTSLPVVEDERVRLKKIMVEFGLSC